MAKEEMPDVGCDREDGMFDVIVSMVPKIFRSLSDMAQLETTCWFWLHDIVRTQGRLSDPVRLVITETFVRSLDVNLVDVSRGLARPVAEE